ncbi:MAG: YdhR family protein [Candidatus Omnitrophica bacterium]|nr:YdhR family protein [Candidatus Omnitrophota bacterium]MCA9414679.1 YdhR family protein [Candidatus Omnitrophota bacterium]MCA9430808.1 YdhR family protein [Candidatus Omnitrophota bacterium]MCA9434446.1 YdhR family protein [Candidatus Omnitrophota bacterium]MCA9446024.1 YdhR family protein [Candidatus Omnitrophota bacterium]
MSKKILEVKFHYSVSTPELEAGAEPLINQVANVPGLIWKIWILNERDQITGGIYYFEDEEDARAYVDGPVFAQIKGSPVFSDFQVKMFDPMDRPSQSTRAPL